ncbi:MAG: DHH family phosphoesterase [Treponema sp.]|jgi:nanoRNase/pAp phosphatase (c-di-AMP/oligoRNAs hydrolase)|nr:DHH family phosphoesterase [Treponema sp.]
MEKKEIRTIAEKNRCVKNIIDETARLNSFLLVGHQNPDTDCIASLAAFSLLLRKQEKDVSIFLPMPVMEQFNYLLAICKYNGIDILYDPNSIPKDIAALVILDTPKPEMISSNAVIDQLLSDPGIRKIEIDHHLGADASYAGDPGYCLVSEASSACELIGYLCFKFSRQKDRFPGVDFFSRNIALAVLTGIVGDSHMGKYLKSAKERWYYSILSQAFDKLLVEKTRKNSNNLASMEAIFDTIQLFSVREKLCFDRILKQKLRSEYIFYAALGKEESAELFSRYGNELLVNVSKAAANTLAEDAGKLGLVAYYDDPSLSSFVQFRLRRSAKFTVLDLRTVLKTLGISNGGGHPGAIGFRVLKDEVPDIHAFTAEIACRIDGMIKDINAG